ncbi:MAG: radical SAM protein [Candidatus Brocadiaceae bacterium]|nr:radical SAM protein [Candidatus Brocadiaceae bacterium]
MEVLLIEPPPTSKFGNMRQFGSIGTYKARIAYPPIDLMKIAGYLRKFGVEPTIYDANTLKTTTEDIAKLVEKGSPRLVVFTTSTTTLNHDMKVAKRIKEISKDVLTATFGAHIKGAPVQTLKENPYLDIAIYGDQEHVIKELVMQDYKLSEVGGIYYRKGSEIIKNNPHSSVLNLDEYGIAAHDLIDPKLYHDPFAKRSPLTITYGQIGCVNKCTYCMSTLYGSLRFRSVPHFLEEIRFIKKLGFKEVFFIDCGFTNNPEWADMLFNSMIRESINLTWWCLSRADRLNEERLGKMKKAGCHSIGMGVESVDPDIIERVRKNVDTQHVLNLVRMIHKYDMRVLLYFQFGLPGETRETMQNTLNFALKSGADLVTFGTATPVPGTQFYDYIKKNNYFITKDWSKFDPTLPPVYSYPHLSSEEIFEFSQYAYRAFYMRPSYVLKRFISQRSFHDFKNNIENFINLAGRLFTTKDNKAL